MIIIDVVIITPDPSMPSVTSRSLPPALAKIVQRFEQISEPKRRMSISSGLPCACPPSQRLINSPVIKSWAVSQVYITATVINGVVHFQGDSDAQLTKRLAGLLIEGLNGWPPA